MGIGLNELQAAVTQEIFPEVSDSLQYSTALWNHLSTKGKKKQDGGLYLQFPLKALVNASQGAIAGDSGLTDATPSQQLIYGILYWKYNYFAVNLTLQDMNVAQGDNQKVEFAVEKAQGAKADFFRSLSVQSWGTSASNSLLLDGMLDILAASGTSYAGILNTTYDPVTYSATNIKNVYSPLVYTDQVMAYALLSKMTTGLMARMQQGFEQTQELMGFCNDYVYASILNVTQASQLLGDVAKANLGFRGFKLNGICDVYLDVNSPGSGAGTADNYLTMFPEKALKFYYNYGLGNESPIDGKMDIPGTVINSNRYFLTGNMVSPDRRMFVVAKTIK
jgi:hypothetical protein